MNLINIIKIEELYNENSNILNIKKDGVMIKKTY